MNVFTGINIINIRNITPLPQKRNLQNTIKINYKTRIFNFIEIL